LEEATGCVGGAETWGRQAVLRGKWCVWCVGALGLWQVGELRRFAETHNINISDCFEKDEIVKKIFCAAALEAW